MYVLVPDDPVFFAQFQSLEDPLLQRLHQLHSAGRDSEEERIVSDGYDSWVHVLLKLPVWSRWNPGAPSAASSTQQPRYALYGTDGDKLTSLYPTEVAGADLGRLSACLDLLTEAERHRRRPWTGRRQGQGRPVYKPPSPSPPSAPPSRERSLTDVFRRVLEVLLLPPPEALLTALRQIVPADSVASVALSAEREAEYWEFCEEVVAILSAGDPFAFSHHRALYR